jgi:hypothetical protein
MDDVQLTRFKEMLDELFRGSTYIQKDPDLVARVTEDLLHRFSERVETDFNQRVARALDPILVGDRMFRENVEHAPPGWEVTLPPPGESPYMRLIYWVKTELLTRMRDSLEATREGEDAVIVRPDFTKPKNR